MKNQHGLSALGLIFVMFVLGMSALLVFKLFPAYTEYFMIQKTFKNLTVNPGLQDGKEVKNAFRSNAIVNNITGIDENDIEITNTSISARYSVRVPLFGNVSLVLEFNPSATVN